MPRRLGGFGACKCCRCTDCCSGFAPYAWYVEVDGIADSTCTFCDEAMAGIWYITEVGDGGQCAWQDYFGDSLYWVYSDTCEGTIVIDGLEFTWRLRFFFFTLRIEVECIDDETYGVTVTLTQEWLAENTDPVSCCGVGITTGSRRAVGTYYLEQPRGSGDCAAWSSLSIPLQSTAYEYWDTLTDPLNPFWTPMTPSTYSPCTFPSSITITAAV